MIVLLKKYDKNYSSRSLSYTARLQLIKSIIFNLHFYWAQIFIILMSILKEVEKICRAFLWSGCYYNQNVGNIDWDTIFTPKQAGRLGVRKIKVWNKAALAKYVWALETRQDNLWIKRDHTSYIYIKPIKAEEWWKYKPPADSNWCWMQLLQGQR